MESELVNLSAKGSVDFLQRTIALHGVALAFFLIPFDEGGRLRVVDVKALLDCFCIVIRTT